MGIFSHKMARLATGRVSMDPAEVATTDYKTWWEYAYHIDMEAHVQQAIEIFKSLTSRESIHVEQPCFG